MPATATTAPPCTLRDAAAEFLAQDRIAVAGVSRDEKQPANLIYRRLRDAGLVARLRAALHRETEAAERALLNRLQARYQPQTPPVAVGRTLSAQRSR